MQSCLLRAGQPWMSGFYFIYLYFFNRVLAERANAHGCPERTHEPLSISRQDEARWKRQRYGWKGTEKAEGQHGHGMSASPPAASLHGDVAGCWGCAQENEEGKEAEGRQQAPHTPPPAAPGLPEAAQTSAPGPPSVPAALLAAFSPASPFILCCSFYCTALASKGLDRCWWAPEQRTAPRHAPPWSHRHPLVSHDAKLRAPQGVY